MGWKKKIIDKGKSLFEDVKETTDVLIPPELDTQSAATITEPCNFWCFILGIGCSFTCPLPKGHEGDHRIGLTMAMEPKCHFEISWNIDE